MLALNMQQTLKYPWVRRRTVIILGILLTAPLVLIGLLRLMATDSSKAEVMEVARAVLEEHIGRNPPNRTWEMTGNRINEDGQLEMDVNVTSFHQAQVIQSRTGRVKYSYMKLACPALEAKVYDLLPKDETIWVQLHYNGTPIVRGACPLARTIF